MNTLVKRIIRQPRAVFPLIVFAVTVLAALVSLIWLPHSPSFANTDHQWSSPNTTFWLGTDGAGRDIFSRLLTGSRTTILVATSTGALSLVFGLGLAFLGALGPRILREPIAVLIDVLVAFPTLLIAMMLAAVFGGSIPVVVTALGVGFGVSVARIVRGELAQVAREDYVLAARAIGVSRSKILWRHILPGASPVIIVQLTLVMGLSLIHI